jgi:putative membrane protein
MIDDLTAAHEKKFDKTYAKQQVKTHEAAVKFFSRYAEKGDDAVVKAFAAKILPEIKQHLEEAKKLAR